MTRTSGSYTANLLGTIRSHLAGLQGYDVMALELIQNADDAKAAEIAFDITDSGLRVRNSGTFTYCGDLTTAVCRLQDSDGYSCDYHRIVDVASGGKLGQSENIGRFGIGFVSAYQITDHPRIQSAGISLTLKPETGQWALESLDETPGTEFFLPWASDPNTKARQALGVSHVGRAHIEQLTADVQNVVRQSLLFLRHVTKAEVRKNGKLLAAGDLDRGDGTDLLVSFRPGDDVEHWHILRADAAERSRSLYSAHPRLESLRRGTKISIGLRVDPQPLNEGLLYAFLPTEQPTGLPLHINADFFPESDRKAIIFAGHQHEQAWNEMLMDVAAAELARDPVGLRKTLGDTQFWQVLSDAFWLQSKSGYPSIFRQFWERLKAACVSAPVVLTQDGSFRRPNETILPSRPLFTPRQAGIVRELGGHVAVDTLQSHRNAMIQLGAQILTLDRLLTLVAGGLSVLKAGESQMTPERIDSFYKPLWNMLADLLPDSGSLSPAMANAVQRLKGLPAIVSEDLYCVTIDQSYAAPSTLNTARIAELLPKLSIATEGLSAAPKVLSLVPVLDLTAIVTHLSELVQNNSLADGGISVAPKDLKDLYNLFADLDVGKQANDSVYKELRTLPVWLSSRGLTSARTALLPGNFTDPSGVGDLLDTSVLSEGAKEFVRTKLGVVTQSIEAFVETVVPTFFGKGGPADPSKYQQLISELANHPSLLDNENCRQILGGLPVAPTQDGGWSRPVEMYRRTDALVRVLGDAKHLWLDTDRTLKTRSVQGFLDHLGLRSTPMAQHLVDRMLSIAKDQSPTDEAKRASAEAFYGLCDNFDTWKDKQFFQDCLGILRRASCFPAEDDSTEWHTPASLYAPYRAEAFRSQAEILDFKTTARLNTPLLKALGIKTDAETELVIRHLQHCMENDDEPSVTTYQILSERATQDRGMIEALADSRCIYVTDPKSFVHPNRLFWSSQSLGRFAFTVPQNLNLYRVLFDALRVKDGPGAPDYVRIIREISDECFPQSKALQGPDRTIFDSCWKDLAALHDREDLDDNDVRELQEGATIVNVRDHLVDPDEVLIQDSEWYAGFFDGELDSALCKPLPDLWPLFQKIGVGRLSARARVALEFTDGDELEETDIATTLTDRLELILRLLHDKPEAVRGAVASALADVKAASYEVVRIKASVQIGDSDDPPQPARPMRTQAYFDRDTHLLWLERPVGLRSWPHILNALLHQLIPDAAGGEIPKLTLSLRPLMALSVEDGHRELSDAGVPELEDIMTPLETEDLTSPELGAIGAGATTQEDGDMRPGSQSNDAGSEFHVESDAPPAPGPSPNGQSQQSGKEAGSAPPQSGLGVPGAGTKKSRPQHKVQRDKRLLSYVNHGGGNDSDSGDGGNSEHNMAIEAAARNAVCNYEIVRGRTPKQMPLTHPGYDIVSQDLVRGTQRLIEVKGVAGEWNRTGVGLSRLQFTNAQEYPEQYWLYVVEFVSDPPRMRIHPIAKPATQVTSFMFDTNWRALVDEEPIDPAIVFKRGVRVRHLTWGYGRIADVVVHGSSRVLAIDFEKSGRQTVPFNVITLSLVDEEEDGDALT